MLRLDCMTFADFPVYASDSLETFLKEPFFVGTISLGWIPYTSQYGLTTLTKGFGLTNFTFKISRQDLTLVPLRIPFMVAVAGCVTAAAGELMVVDLDGPG